MTFRKILVFLFSVISLSGYSVTPRDTVSVMVYNLLFYGNYTSFCNPQNNNIDNKDAYLRTIIAYTQPDLFAVNEMGPDPANATRIKQNVLNADGRTGYDHASYTNTTGSGLVNMLFYNTEKFVLYSEAVAAAVVRDINLYTLYYNDPLLGHGNDTIFLHVFVTHMKAGSSASDQQRRMQEATAVMGFIEQMDIRGNLLFMGDFNMNSSYEQAFQLITYHPNESIRFYDPIDQPGVWWNNPEMAPYHTQSTRTGQHDCFVTGGMDDRYDFILATESVMEGREGVVYIEESYRTIGQDGLRFNQSLISPPNESGDPHEVILALFNMSDHLPVQMKLGITDYVSNITPILPQAADIKVTYDKADARVDIQIIDYSGLFGIEIVSLAGITVFRQTDNALISPAFVQADVSGFAPGLYLIAFTPQTGNKVVEKVFIY